MYAVIKTGGKQYKVSEGLALNVELLKNNNKVYQVGDKVEFEDVVLLNSDDKLLLSQTDLKKAKIVAKVLSLFKDKKVTTIKFRRRTSGSKTTIGHRQNYARVQIENIFLDGAATKIKTVTKKTVKKKDTETLNDKQPKTAKSNKAIDKK